MDATIPRRRPPGMAALLVAVAVIAVVPTLMTGSGTHAQALAGAAGSGLAAAVAGTLIRKASRDEDAWPSGAGIAWAMFLIAAVSFAYLFIGSTSDTANHPRPADALLLLLLIPLTIAMRDELRVHFDTGDRREIAIDVMLIAASVGAILYLLIRPPGAGPTESGVAGVIAILAASQFTSFAALTLWVPTVSHLLQFLAFAGYSIATVLFGWMWTRGGGGSGDPGRQHAGAPDRRRGAHAAGDGAPRSGSRARAGSGNERDDPALRGASAARVRRRRRRFRRTGRGRRRRPGERGVRRDGWHGSC